MIAEAKQPEVETETVGPQPGPQTAFLETTADICFYGGQAGGGKSYAVLLDMLRWSGLDDFEGVIFRRTCPQLTGSGSLWAEMRELYTKFGAVLREGNTLDATFPSGARVELRHLQRENTKFDHQGKQYAVIVFEEVTHFTETQFWYLISRSRSKCGLNPYLRATCNPDAASWVAPLIQWWWDPITGLAIPERSGVIRWLARVEGVIHWADSRQELIDQFPNISEDNLKPKSFTFIPSKLEDNPALLINNPDYRANLLLLPPVEQARLADGNWLITDHSGGEWPAEYFTGIWFDTIPEDEEIIYRVTSLDPSKGQRETSDFQALVSVAISSTGNCYVDASLIRVDIVNLADATAAFLDELRADEFVVEENGFQELLVHEINRACTLAGISIPVFGHLNTKNKIVRIRRLGTPLAKNRLFFRRGSEGCTLLVNQMQQFPHAKYDDGPDALEMAISHADRQLDGLPDYYQAEEQHELQGAG